MEKRRRWWREGKGGMRDMGESRERERDGERRRRRREMGSRELNLLSGREGWNERRVG